MSAIPDVSADIVASSLMGKRDKPNQDAAEQPSVGGNDPYPLPPVGQIKTMEDRANAWGLLTAIIRESSPQLDDHCLKADVCLNLFEHGADPPPKTRETISNMIQDDVLMAVNGLLSSPPTITFKPTVVGDTPQVVETPSQPQMDPQTGQPVMDVYGFPMPGQFIITDSVQCEFEKKLLDHFWDGSTVLSQLKGVVLNVAIAGWYLAPVEFDVKEMKFKIYSSISHRQSCLDITTGPIKAVENANYAWMRWYKDRWQARSDHPAYVKQIEASMRVGNSSTDGLTQLGGNITGVNFGRAMVDMHYLWLANQPYMAMTPWEATQYGYVEAGNANNFVLAGTTTVVDPTSPEWPWWLCTRRLTFMLQELVDDTILQEWGIPMLHCCAIPVPFTFMGQGFPWGKRNLQAGRNRALTNMVDHTDLFAHPILVVPESAYTRLPQQYKAHGASRAGMMIRVDDETYMKLGGKIQSQIVAEPISPSLPMLIQLLHNELNDRAQQPNVQAGKQEGNITGWQSIQLLQQAANTRHEFEAGLFEDMVWRLVQLMRHDILWKLDVAQLAAICPQYPIEAVDAMQKRGRERYEQSVEITVSPASGGASGRKIAEAIQKFGTADEFGNRVIGMDTLRERWNEDNRTEMQKQQQTRMQAMAMGALMGQPPGGQPGGQPGQPAGNEQNSSGAKP